MMGIKNDAVWTLAGQCGKQELVSLLHIVLHICQQFPDNHTWFYTQPQDDNILKFYYIKAKVYKHFTNKAEQNNQNKEVWTSFHMMQCKLL